MIDSDTESLYEVVYLQDLLTKTIEANANTLIAEVQVSIRLYEEDFVDSSTLITHGSVFGSYLGEELALDADTGRVEFVQGLLIVSDLYRVVESSRECALHSNFTLTQMDASESEKELVRQTVKSLPEIIQPWAKQFNDNYSEENAYFLTGVGTDQDVSDKQRLYFVDISLQRMDTADAKCFPEQIKGLFLNKRKNEWISRFMGYGIMNLLVCGLSIVMSVLQYRDVKFNLLQGRAAAKHISLVPLTLLTSFTFQGLLLNLIISSALFLVDALSQILPILAMLGVLMAFYAIMVRAAATKTHCWKQSDLIVLIFCITFMLIILSERFMTSNMETICLFGFLWVPQIVTNFFTHPSWQFHYRFGF